MKNETIALRNYLVEKERLDKLPVRNANGFIDKELAQAKAVLTNRIRKYRSWEKRTKK